MSFREKFSKEYKGAFATNSVAANNSLVWKSMPLWIDFADDNLIFIPGVNGNMPFYGVNAFIYMIQRSIALGYDYVIYFDEDAFLVPGSEKLLEELFLDFANSGCVVAGSPDGGSFCHRNHNNLMVNTFFSMWNIKAIKESGQFASNLEEFLKTDVSFENFTKQISSIRLSDMESRSKKALEFSKMKNSELAKDFPDNEFPYCKIVKNDVNNPVEPHQVPYSYKQDNFEPYYVLLEFLVKFVDKPIYYFNCSDYADADDDKSKSGVTSAVYDKSGKTLLMLHTWFSRDYTRENSVHKPRILSVIDFVKNLNNA